MGHFYRRIYKKTKFLLDQIISKSFKTDIEQEDINKTLNFLKTEWKNKSSDQKEFLTLMHTEIPFLGSLIKYASDYKYEDSHLPFMHFEDAALAFMQKGLSTYRRFKNTLAPGLDLSRLYLSEMGFNDQGFFLSSPVVEKIYPHMNKDGLCHGLS